MENKFKARLLEKADFLQVEKLLQELVDAQTPINIEEFAKNQNAFGFVVEENAVIIGFGAMIAYFKPTFAKVAQIEDVIVSMEHQKRGVGTAIMQKLIETAKKENIAYLNLTSNPQRIAAINLYKKLGFKNRETEVLFLKID